MSKSDELAPTPASTILDKQEDDSVGPRQDEEKDEALEKPPVFRPEETTYPEGGRRGWAVAIGSSTAIFSTFGWANTWGVFQEYYMTHQLAGQSPSAISWIGSLQIFVLFSGGLFGGPLFDIYGEKALWCAAPIFLVSVFLTSICKEYYQFMLCQGILCGIGMGLTMSPCFTAVSHYFNKKRGAALGLAVAGSSLGGVIWPIVLNKMLHSSLGFGWSIRICAFAMTALVTVSIAGIKARLPPRGGKLFLPAAFKELPYSTLVFAMFLTTIGIFIPIFYLPSYAVQHGMSTHMSFYLLSILNGASFFGRVIPGITADMFGALNMLVIAATSTGILIFCWPSCTSNVGIIVFSAFYGFCSGAIVSLQSVAMTRVPKDPRQMGTYVGMGMLFMSIGALIGPPINGALVSKYGGYREASIFSGVLVLAGAAAVVVSKWATGGLLAKI